MWRTSVRCIWLTKTTKENKTMTPNDIATDVSTVQNLGSVNLSTNFTYSFQRMDDSNTWD